MSATILTFPAHQRAAAPPARLNGAIAAMDAALEAQRCAIGSWRGAIDDLRRSHAALEANVARFRDRLDGVARQTAAFKRTAWEDTLPEF
jgi:hypothetical protein